jgi:hypothetical protein
MRLAFDCGTAADGFYFLSNSQEVSQNAGTAVDVARG